MPIRFRCRSCRGLMSISSRRAGAVVACPTCGNDTLVPMQDEIENPYAHPKPMKTSDPLVSPDVFAEAFGSSEREGDSFGTLDQEKFNQHELDQEEMVFQAASPPTGLPPIPRGENSVKPPPQLDSVKVNEASSVVESQSAVSWAAEDSADEGDGADDEPPPLIRRRKPIDDEMDLTPMVDVTFQLLIFFMVTASFSLQKSIEVPTPDPDQKGATQQMQTLEDLQGTSIIVKIDAANSITIDDDPLLDPARLADTLRDKMRKEQKTELLLTANRLALHRTVISVIDAANEIGIQKIKLGSRAGGQE